MPKDVLALTLIFLVVVAVPLCVGAWALSRRHRHTGAKMRTSARKHSARQSLSKSPIAIEALAKNRPHLRR